MATIADYRQAWKDANAKGDKAGMDAAHKGAEAIRKAAAPWTTSPSSLNLPPS